MTKNRFVVYARAAGSEGVEQQVERCQRYAETADIEIVEVVADIPVSGFDTRLSMGRRPVVLEKITTHEVEGVLVSHLSRLGRSAMQLNFFVGDAMNAGGHLVSVAENMDTRKPEQRAMVETIVAAMRFVSEDEG